MSENIKNAKLEGSSVSLEKLSELLSGLTVMEASELASVLEKKWNVSPTMSVASAAPAGTTSGPAPAQEEKTEFSLFITDVGPNKMKIIQEVKKMTNLGLVEAKTHVESACPINVMGDKKLNKEDAQKYKTLLEEHGAKVELK